MKSSSRLYNACLNIVFYFIAWLAIWTVGSNIVSLIGLSATILPYVFFLSILLIISLIFSMRMQLEDYIHVNPTRAILPEFPPILLLVFVTVVGFSSVALVYKTHYIAIFISGLLLALAALLYTNQLKRSSDGDFNNEDFNNKVIEIENSGDWIYLTVLFALLITLYLFGHQSDYDDANFINLGIGAFRSNEGVFVLDTMLGDGPTPIHLPTYRVQSFELLFATLSHLFPGTAIFYAHLVLPVLFVGIFSLVLYLIFRPVLGVYWIVGAIIYITIIVASFDGYRSLGAHGLFRFFQGKVFFIQVLIPLICLIGFHFCSKPKIQSWIFLFFLMIVSTGMTANAIYAAPLCLGLVVFVFFSEKPFNFANYKMVFIALLSCIYPILAGAFLVFKGTAYPSQFEFPPKQAETLFSYFGWNLYGIILWSLLPLTILIITVAVRSKKPLYYLLGLIIFIFNPLLWPLYSYATGNLNFRIYWSIPFVYIFSLGLCYIYLVLANSFNFTQFKKLSFMVGISFFIFTGVLFERTVFRESDIKINWRLPGLRVESQNFEIAKLISLRPITPCRIVVPTEIAHQVTMIKDHPYPIAVDNMYQTHYRHTMDSELISQRSMLLNSVDSQNAARISAPLLSQLIDDFHIALVLIKKQNLNIETYKSILFAKSFSSETLGEYNLFYHACEGE